MLTSTALTIASDAPGKSLFLLGNEAFARGAIEAGVQVAAAYPGTPSTEIMEALVPLAKKLDMYVEWSVNEKVAFEVALAASMCGVRALSVMKHVGVNVALDAIMAAGYIGARGGLVLISADDPGQWSSQTEQDNRYIAQQAYIPVLEPSTSQEALEMMVAAFKLSEEYGQPFMLRSETRIGHSRGDVVLGEISRIRRHGFLQKDIQKLVALPANARRNRKLMVDRMAKIQSIVDTLPFNQLKLNPSAKLGLITSGISYTYVLEALRWLDMENKVSLLKVGTPYPLPQKLVRVLLHSSQEIVVVEELEPIIEGHVKAIAQEEGLTLKIHGKDIIPLIGELSTRRVAEALAKITSKPLPMDFSTIDNLVREVAPLLPLRPPTLCAGCPHRATLYAINQACERVKKETGLEPVKPGDIGCYSLGANAPLLSDDTATCMGGGFDIANGMARVLKEPVIGHLGDSTFFHSGIAPMLNAVYNQTRLTMVVMDNSTTAMTGMQPHPGSGQNASSQGITPIRPEEIARASGVKLVEVIDPLDLNKAVDLLEKAIRFEGPSMVVSRHPCNVLEQRQKRLRGEKVFPYSIDQAKCAAHSLPNCTAACPLQIDVRGYVKLIGEGRYAEALQVIRQKLPFPGIMGRICTRPCESQCQRREVDESIAIAALKRSAADYGQLIENDLSIAAEKEEKVAIVGGGPAGIMAAYDLRKLGYRVTLFEALPVLGGMLAVGIPGYRLPRNILESEIDIIRQLGVEIKLNTRIGTDISLSQLVRDYSAVFMAVGAHRGRNPGIENDQERVIKGIDFLRDINLGRPPEVKKRVLIVGGGNVAIDCARNCVRQGFREVTVMYRRSRNEMPAIHEEIDEAEKEGVRFRYLAVPVRVLNNGSGPVGVECVRMHLGKPDASGRRRPVPVVNSGFKVETDLIVAATGEEPDLGFIQPSETPLEIRDGKLAADPVTLATRLPKVFAGGDAVTGSATVVEALAAGRKAAVSIDLYLQGASLSIGRENEGPKQKSPLKVNTEGVPSKPRAIMPTLGTELRTDNLNEVELGFSRDQAQKEALRCLSCNCQVCITSLGCPAILIENNEVIIDDTQCPGCGLCAQICPQEAISQKKEPASQA